MVMTVGVSLTPLFSQDVHGKNRRGRKDLNGYDRWGFPNPGGLLREQYLYFQHHFTLYRERKSLVWESIRVHSYCLNFFILYYLLK